MDDYYAPHPRVALDEPVVLAGHVGSGVSQVVHAMAARSGLPFAEVDRMLEAAEGESLSRIAVRRGFACLSRLAVENLERALRRRPSNLVVLGSPAVEAPVLRAALGSARLVYLHRPPAVLLARLQRRQAEQPGSLFGFPLGVPADEAELVAFQGPTEALLRTADVVVEAGDRHATTVARELLQSLDRIVGLERV